MGPDERLALLAKYGFQLLGGNILVPVQGRQAGDVAGLQADPAFINDPQFAQAVHLATPQDLANLADPNAPGNNEGGSDLSNILKGVAFVGGGAALVNSLANAGIISADGAWGVNPVSGGQLTPGGGNFDWNAISAADDAAGGAQYLANTGQTYNGFLQSLVSAGVPAGAAAAAASAVGKGFGVTEALKLAGVAAPVIGALVSSGAIKDATATQQQATDQAIGAITGNTGTAQGVQTSALQQGIDSLHSQYDKGVAQQNESLGTTISDLTRRGEMATSELRPYAETGVQATNRLGDVLGISGRTDAPNYGDLTKKFTLADFWDDPVTKASYQQGLELGTKSLQNSAARNGMLNSGATAKALARFGTDYTGTQAAGSQARFVNDQNNTYTRLRGVADQGQSASGQIAGNDITVGNLIGGYRANTANNIATGGNLMATNEAQLRASTGTNLANQGIAAGNNIASLISGQGNAAAAGSIAQGNQIAGAGNSIANWFNSQDTLDKILAARKTT